MHLNPRRRLQGRVLHYSEGHMTVLPWGSGFLYAPRICEVRSGYCTGNSKILSLLSMESCNSGVCTGVATCPYSRYNYLFNMLVMHVKRVTVSIDFEFMSLG